MYGLFVFSLCISYNERIFKNEKMTEAQTSLPEDLNSENLLSPDDEKITRKSIENFLEDMSEGVVPHWDHSLWEDAAIIALAPLSPAEYDHLRNRQILPKFRKIAKIFFEELQKKIEEKRDSFSSVEIEHFCSFVREILFASSETISGYLSFPDFIKFTASFTSIPETQGNIGGTMVGEIVYNLSFCKSVENLINEIVSFSTSEIIDILNLLGKVSSSAASQGSWSENGWKKSVEIIQGIREKESSHFIQYACQKALLIAGAEWENPSGSILFYPGNRAESRLPENLAKNDQEMSENINRQILPENINSLGRFLPVAKGVIANFDHSLRPQDFGNYNLENSSQSAEISTSALNVFINALQNVGNFNEYVDVLFEIYESVFKKLFGENALKKWQEVFPVLSEKEWKLLFQQEQSIQTLQSDFQQKAQILQNEGEEACLKISDDFIRELQEFITNHGARLAEIYPYLANSITSFESELRDENIDRAFSAAQSIIFPFHLDITRDKVFQCLREADSNDLSEEIKRIVDDYDQINVRHRNIWNKIREKHQDESIAARKDIETVAKQGEPLFQKLEDHEKGIESLSKALVEIKSDLSKNLTIVPFRSYAEIVSDRTLNPFPEENDEDMILLLQELQSPEMRGVILNDLDIDVREMSFAAQIHFLRFLQDKDSSVFEKLREVLRSKPENQRQDILESFLACAEDRHFGEIILALAEEEAGQEVFSVYVKTIK